MTPESDAESMQGGEVPEPKNFFTRLSGVYFSPRETFREIGSSPQVLIPIIVLIAFSALVGFYLARNLDLGSMIADRMERAVAEGRMTREQMEQQISVISKFAQVQLIAGSAFGSLAITLLIAAGFKLISSFIDATNRFKAVFAVSLYTMIAVSIIQSGLIILVIQVKGTGDLGLTSVNSLVTSNLGAVLAGIWGEDALPKFFMQLAGFIDIFAIWIIALLAIGYAAVSRRLKTSTAAIWLGAAYAVIAIIGSAIGSAFAG